jgi:hypothetical protein
MRREALLVALVTLGSLTLFVSRSTASSLSIGVNFFFDALASQGHWFQMENYGWVWTPRHVAADWRPYTLGHWAYSDGYGWVWVSDEAFGWATYHYGRWYYDADYGWVWVPGDQWSPAWVSWRFGGGYAGWAPLPPGYDWQGGGGYYPGGAYYPGGLSPTDYVFVPELYISDPVVYRHIVPWDRDDSIARLTRDFTRYQTVGGHVVDRAVPVRDIERAVGRAVPRYRVEAVRSGPSRAVVQGKTVRIFHPTRKQIARAPAPRMAFAPSAVPRVKARPAAPPANPRAVHLERTPAPAPNAAAARAAERQNQRVQQQRRQEQARQQRLAREREAQRQRQQAQAERHRQPRRG